MAMAFTGVAAISSRYRRAAFAASIAWVGLVSLASASACESGDTKLVARYTTPVRGITDQRSASTLQLDRDGSFRWSGLPLPVNAVGGCWRRLGDIVSLETHALDGGDGVKRSMPDPLTQADLDRVTRFEHQEIRTIAQAVEAGLLANGRLWAYQTRTAGEPVRVKIYEPTVGVSPGDAKVTLTLADGRKIEGAQLSEDDQVIDRHPRPAGGEYLFTALPANAVVTAVGIVFPNQPDRPRSVPIDDGTRRLYMIEFDANDTGSIFGGVIKLNVLGNGNLGPAPPDEGPAFERLP